MMSSPLLVNGMLEPAAALFPGVAIVSMQPDGSRHSYTYRDLRRRSRQLAAALEAAGIAQGDCVATLTWSGHEHLEAYFGVPLTGAVLHTLNLRLHPDELATIVNHAQDRSLIVKHVLLDALRSLALSLPDHFPRWHVPDGFVFVNELAHTSTGKLLKSKLRQDFGYYLKDLQAKPSGE